MRYILVILWFMCSASYGQVLNGKITGQSSKESLPFVKIENLITNNKTRSNIDGKFSIQLNTGDSVRFSSQGYDTLLLLFDSKASFLDIQMEAEILQFGDVNVNYSRIEKYDVDFLPVIKGTRITTGTNAVISVESMNGSKSSGNPRELFAYIPGLNIWESDGAGIQIGIGGRGLSPNRAANFNTRQNGYDISADALGYPESYYTPPIEALSSIEIVRGSASLQYGTQFGGLLNFVLKEPEEKSAFAFTTRQTGGNYGYYGEFNRVSGTKGRFSYQAYHQIKTGNGYRENSEFTQYQAFAQVSYDIAEYTKIRLEYTQMNYLARQAGGLSDVNFNENDRQSLRDRNWFNVNWNMMALHFDHTFSSRSRLNFRTFGMLSSRKTLGFLGKITQADPGGNREMITGDFKNAGAELRYLTKYRFAGTCTHPINGAILFGARYYRGITSSLQGKATDGSDANFMFINPDNLENSSYLFPSRNLAFFAENVVFISRQWRVNFGGRLESISSASEGFYKSYAIHPVNGDTLGVYRIDSENQVDRLVPLFGAGASFQTKKMNSLYINFTQNYRAINFTDIRVNNPNIVVDTAMRDEYGHTGEFGFRGKVKKYWIFDLALFHVFYGDKIGLAPKPGTTYKERTNIGDAVNTGIEIFTEFDLLNAMKENAKQQLSVFVNAAYIQSYYLRSKEPNYIGKQVEYVAPLIVRGGLKYKVKNWSSQFQASYTSEQYSDASNALLPSGDAVIGLVSSYFIMDLSTRYEWKYNLSFELSVNNLTNQKYFTRRASGYPGPGILPSDGIQIFGTLQYKFSMKRKP